MKPQSFFGNNYYIGDFLHTGPLVGPRGAYKIGCKFKLPGESKIID